MRDRSSGVKTHYGFTVRWDLRAHGQADQVFDAANSEQTRALVATSTTYAPLDTSLQVWVGGGDRASVWG